jgi:hypothetical protein
VEGGEVFSSGGVECFFRGREEELAGRGDEGLEEAAGRWLTMIRRC